MYVNHRVRIESRIRAQAPLCPGGASARAIHVEKMQPPPGCDVGVTVRHLWLPVVLPFGTGELAVPPGGVATMPVTLLPGPIRAGSVAAFVDCFDNEPIANLRTTTVTRTLVEEGEPCVALGAP